MSRLAASAATGLPLALRGANLMVQVGEYYLPRALWCLGNATPAAIWSGLGANRLVRQLYSVDRPFAGYTQRGLDGVMQRFEVRRQSPECQISMPLVKAPPGIVVSQLLVLRCGEGVRITDTLDGAMLYIKGRPGTRGVYVDHTHRGSIPFLVEKSRSP